MANLPMREKYIDEAVGVYFIFGHRTGNPELVDISDGQKDVFTGLPKDVAEMVCEAQKEFRDKLYDILNHGKTE